MSGVFPHPETTTQRPHWLAPGFEPGNGGITTCSAFDFNDHPEKSANFDSFPSNRLEVNPHRLVDVRNIPADAVRNGYSFRSSGRGSWAVRAQVRGGPIYIARGVHF